MYDIPEVKRMNNMKTGQMIRQLRKQQNLTQAQLAEILHVSNKTVSKWELGRGYPDLSLYLQLSEILKVDIAALMSGNMAEKCTDSGNLRKLSFYICPSCGNLITSTTETAVSCCGKILSAAVRKRAEDDITVELIDREYHFSSNHEMTREHYISFFALVSSDQLLLKKLYPEWDVDLHLPYIPGAFLVWHCSRHGLFYQPLPQYKQKLHSRAQ